MLTSALIDHYVDSSPGTSFVSSSSYTPLANKLYRIAISHWNSTPPATVSVSAWGLTWSVANSGVGGSSTPDSRVSYVYAWSGASPSSGTITITTSATVDDVIVEIREWSGADSSGTIVQTAKNDSIFSTSITVTLGSAITGNNGVDAAFFNYEGRGSVSPGTGYSLGSEDIDAGDGFAQVTIYKIPGTTTPSISYSGGSLAMAGVAAEIKEAAGALSATVNQATETDTAQAVTWAPKKRTVGQVTEADIAQPVTRRKALTVGQVIEVDFAQAITRVKRKTIGQVSETDLAQTVTRSGVTVAVGQVNETDTAQAIAWAPKRRLVGQALEQDLAQPIVRAGTTAPSDWLIRARRRGRR